MLRARRRLEAVDHLERLGIDHVDPAGGEIGRIDPGRLPVDRRAEHACRGPGVDVVRIDGRWRPEVHGRQINRFFRAELVGGERDEVARGPALLDDAMTDVGAGAALGARERNGERLRGAQPKTRADRDRDHRGGSREALAKTHPAQSIEPAFRKVIRQSGSVR